MSLDHNSNMVTDSGKRLETTEDEYEEVENNA